MADGGVANPLEAVEDLLVAVEMPLGDLPVVGAGVARGARVGDDDALLELRADRRRVATRVTPSTPSSTAAIPPYRAGR